VSNYVTPEPLHNRKRVPYTGARKATKGAIVLAVLCLLSTGCRAGYVTRVGLDHLRYVRSAQPIDELIEGTEDVDRRERLELVLEARSWAAANGLDVGGSYAEVANTDGLTTAHVVTAAYSDRLEPYEWSYPIIGKIPYRGYFEREPADRFAATLADDGLDTYIVEASGYSTLGWFDDPLPSGVLERDRVGIVSFLFHELLHQTIYVPGSIAFNETLASAVSARMTEEFFVERDDDAALDILHEWADRWLDQASLCDDLAERLTEYFAKSGGAPDLDGRFAIYRDAIPELRRLKLVAPAGEDTVQPTLNNAWFLAIWRYRKGAHQMVDYLEGFDTVAAALADLKTRIEEAEDGTDPYEALGAVTADDIATASD
jgi:predicted aminopeptidase